VPYDERERVKNPVQVQELNLSFLELLLTASWGGGRYSSGTRVIFIEEDMLDQAAGTGTNLILSGWGGDEFISTGDRGIETDLLRRFRLGIYFRRNPVRPVKRFIKYFLEYTLFPALEILSPNVARSFADDARYLKKPFRKSGRKALRNFYFHTSRRQLHLRYLRFYHLQERCETWYAMAYRKGIEYRFPLLDRRIVEYMIMIPSELLCREDYFRPLLRVLGEGIIPDDIRLSTSKKDHVYSAWWKELISYSGRRLIEEAGSWRDNPDLGFVDFDLLDKDIAQYRSDPGSTDQEVLFNALVFIKAVHQFSLSYREK
jgi:asparagine synthase (glutamine-hydrolysing)